MLSKSFIFAFVFLCGFALLFGTMDSRFLALQSSDTSFRSQEEEIAKVFSLANMTIYKYGYLGTFETFPAENTTTTGMPSGDLLSFQWSLIGLTIPAPIPFTIYVHGLRIKHLTDYTPIIGWWGQHDLSWFKSDGSTPAGTIAGNYHLLQRADLVENWNPTANASVFHASCEYVRMNFAIQPYNSTLNITQAWDAGYMRWMGSFGVDQNLTGLNAWSVMGQMLTFQQTDLGIPGIGGVITNGIIAAIQISVITYVLVKITLAIVPFISGLSD